MKETSPLGPQRSLLFRVVAFVSRLRLDYLHRTKGTPRFLVVIFVFTAGATAVAIITIAAHLSHLPLLFPPLGPTAFILFYTPMAVEASPRNVILAHASAVSAGLLSLYAVGAACPDSHLSDPSVMNWYRVIAIALSMGLIGVIMITVHCIHPPAAASALIAAMGYLTNAAQVFGLLAAVVLLALQAFFFIRILGGLPYPVWRADPEMSRSYGVLAGIPDAHASFWRQLSSRMFHQR